MANNFVANFVEGTTKTLRRIGRALTRNRMDNIAFLYVCLAILSLNVHLPYSISCSAEYICMSGAWNESAGQRGVWKFIVFLFIKDSYINHYAISQGSLTTIAAIVGAESLH